MRATFLLHLSSLASVAVGFFPLPYDESSSQIAEKTIVGEIETPGQRISEEHKVFPKETHGGNMALYKGDQNAVNKAPLLHSYWGRLRASETENLKPFPLNFYPELPPSTVESQGQHSEGYRYFRGMVQDAGSEMKDELLAALKWPNAPPTDLPRYLDAKGYGNRDFCRMTLNIFPYDLPNNMLHFIVSSWVPMVTKEGFKCQPNEKFPSGAYQLPAKIEALLEYVNKPGLGGYLGNDDTKLKSLKARPNLHNDGRPWLATNGEIVTEDEGRVADEWAMRHFKAYLGDILPVELYEAVWAIKSSPARDENLHQIELVVKIKKAPNIQLMPLKREGSTGEIEIKEPVKNLPEFKEFWLWSWVDRSWFEKSWLSRFLENSKKEDFKPAPRNHDQLLQQIVQGIGLYFSREAWSEDGYAWYKKLLAENDRTIEEEMKRILRWGNEAPESVPGYLDAKDYENTNFARNVINIFPWITPRKTFHFSIWSWRSAVTKAGFECGEKETYPSEAYKKEKIDALLEYIEKHDFVGYAGQNVEKVEKMKPCNNFHPEGKAYTAANGQHITREEGWEAMKWARRHFDGYLGKEFPLGYFEVVTTRSPNHNKGVQVEHTQTLVRILHHEEMRLMLPRVVNS